MKALIQRVQNARVEVDENCIGAIGHGLLVFLGVEKHDGEKLADQLVSRLLAYRIFADENDKMNRSVCDVGGGILLVSQFTLVADTRKGLRPSFSPAADPSLAEKLYNYVGDRLSESTCHVATGRFAANMQIHLINDGPVTFLLEL